MKNNFGKYLRECKESLVYISKNGKIVAKMVDYAYDLKRNLNYVAREQSAAYGLDNNSWVSYKDFMKMYEKTDERYELIDGEVYLLASPSFNHQVSQFNILKSFAGYFEGKKCRPLAAPLDIELQRPEEMEERSVVQPDIVVLCDWQDTIAEDGKYMGTPTLAVEILSPSSKSKDMIKKLDLFMCTGISEYWIVDVLNKTVMVYEFREREFEKLTQYSEGDICRSGIFVGLEMPVESMFG